MICTANKVDGVWMSTIRHRCERPMGHGGLHRHTYDTFKSDPPTRTVVEFTTDGETVGSEVITGEGVWIV